MTYGQLKFRLLKDFPGLDIDVLEGKISDAYQDILAELPWSRQIVQAILQTSAPYSTGTVTLTNGSTTVTGSSTVFTTAMTGRAFRGSTRDEFYEFTYVGATSATLDRAYEGTTGSGLSYKVFQHVYPLPSDCRHLDDDAFSAFSLGPLRRLSKHELDRSYPNRNVTGTPEVWSAYMDDSSDPPRMQIELLPFPDAAIGIPFTYIAEEDSPTATGTALLPWIQPTALVEAVMAKIYRTPKFKDLAAAVACETAAARALGKMRNNEALRTGPTRMELDSHYTSHRRRRTCR